MSKNNYTRRDFLRSISIAGAGVSLGSSLFGCVTAKKLTKPNPAYQEPISDKFNTFAKRNPLLAKETLKLPELQDGVSPVEMFALENIVDLYESNTISFSNTFQQMYQVGLPDIRMFSSPLQALFWLVEDNSITLAKEIINDYSLDKLLYYAWSNPIKIQEDFIEKEANRLIYRVKDKELFKKIKKYMEKDFYSSTTVEYIISLAKVYPEAFGFKEINPEDQQKYKNRWKDFDIVADRLNAPELFDYWINRAVTYGDVRIGYTKTAKSTFEDLKGDCSDVVELGKVILGRARYNIKKVCTPKHVMGYIKKDGFYWLVIDFTSMGNSIKGPAKTLYELIDGKMVQCGFGVNP